MVKRSEDIILIENKPYKRKSATTTLRNKEIELNSLEPVLNEDEYTVRSKDIENDLYDVFVKYRSSNP